MHDDFSDYNDYISEGDYRNFYSYSDTTKSKPGDRVYYSGSPIRHGGNAEHQLVSKACGPASKRLACNVAFLRRERDRMTRVNRISGETL